MNTATANRLRLLWRTVPDRRTVSYQARTGVNPSTYSSAVNVTEAFHRDYRTEESAGSSGVYILRRATFYFPKSANSTLTPAVGDRFTDAAATTVPYTGKTFSVESVMEAGGLGAWMVGGVAPEIQAAVDVSVQIVRPDASWTNSGLRKTTPQSTIYTGNGWIQQIASATGDHLGKREFGNEFTVYLPVTFATAIQAQDIVRVNSLDYTIKEFTPAADLTMLPTLTVEVLP